jgi:hypothetical protein
VISFLAGLLGLGGISEKVKAIFDKAQGLVGKAVDWVVDKGLKLARPLIKLAMKGVGYVKKKYEGAKAYVKGKYEAGKAYVKKKYEAAKGYVKGKVEGVKEKLINKPKDARTPAQKKAAVDGAIRDAEAVMDSPDADLKTVAKALPGIKGMHQLNVLNIVRRTPSTFRVHAELNPKEDSKVKGSTRTWSLAPGTFTAHEGTQFTDADGVPMVNRRGDPIMVHTITLHVTIGRGGVEDRVVDGHQFATGFLSATIMEKAVLDCLKDRATELNEKLNEDGKPATNGTSAKVSRTLPYKCGYGYSLLIRPSQANKPPQHRQRDSVEVAESSLASVTVIVRVSDSAKGLYLVETAFPTPRGR